jgi:DNA polymerase III subunit epsilon
VLGIAPGFEPTAPWADASWVVIDFETTGTNPAEDRVIEIGVVGFRGRVIEFREALLVQPGIPIPEESRAIHGITDDELDGAPMFGEIIPRLVELLTGRIPVAYNAAFDRAFLLNEFERAGGAATVLEALPAALDPEVIWIDPLVWAREILKDLKSKRLTDVAAHFGVPLEQDHPAPGDAEATGRVLLELARQMPAAYGELVRVQGKYAAFQDAERSRFRKP